MARPPKFTVDEILDGAREAVVEHWRDATLADVSRAVGAPMGSIYHRFGSRDELFGSLWVRSIKRFHAALLAAGDEDDPQRALEEAAVCVPRFCRDHPADAKAMTLFRLDDLIAKDLPVLRDALSGINDDVDSSLRDMAARRWGAATDGRVRVAFLACRLGPYGLVRPWIGGELPADLEAVVLASARGILALGDDEDARLPGPPRDG